MVWFYCIILYHLVVVAEINRARTGNNSGKALVAGFCIALLGIIAERTGFRRDWVRINPGLSDVRTKLRRGLQQHLPDRQRETARNEQLVALRGMPQSHADVMQRA